MLRDDPRVPCLHVDNRLQMGNRQGQATVEYIALIGGAAALFAVAAIAINPATATRIAASVRDVFVENSMPEPSRAAILFADRAIAGTRDGSAPALHDAIQRLTTEVGATNARRIVQDRALQRYLPAPAAGRQRPLADPSLALARPELNGLGPTLLPNAWSTEDMRAAPTIRLVGGEQELQWERRLIPSTGQRVVELGTSAVVAVAGALNPAVAVAAITVGAGLAAAETPLRGIPAGAREDDVVVCRFVWRTNHAAAGWNTAHPFEASRLRLNKRMAAVDISVFRAGVSIVREIVWNDATTC